MDETALLARGRFIFHTKWNQVLGRKIAKISVIVIPFFDTRKVNRKNKVTLRKIYLRPVLANIRWQDIEVLMKSLGAEVQERTGSRVEIFMFNQAYVFHRPHPSPDTDKGAIVAIRKWLEENGVCP